MRIKLLILGLLFSLGLQAQQLDPQRTGKDSIAIETSMVVMTEKFTTAEINAFTRNSANKPAYVFNSDTETLWAWTGTEWKDLGLAPIAGGITIDQTIQNGSTNPVENNAVYDRLVQVVDEAADSPHKDIEYWFGTKAQYATADKSNPRRFFLVSDSIYDPGPDGNGDGFIQDVTLSGNIMTFDGQGGAANKSINLSSITGNSTDDQLIEQFVYSNLTKNLTIRIENGNTTSTSLAALFQDADEVPFDDSNVDFFADDVQEAIEQLVLNAFTNTFQTGSFSPTIGGDAGGTRQQGIGSYWKLGEMVYFKLLFNNASTSGSQGSLTIDNLPFDLYNNGESFLNAWPVNVLYTNINSSNVDDDVISAWVTKEGGQTFIRFGTNAASNDADDNTVYLPAQNFGGTTYVSITGFYPTN